MEKRVGAKECGDPILRPLTLLISVSCQNQPTVTMLTDKGRETLRLRVYVGGVKESTSSKTFTGFPGE